MILIKNGRIIDPHSKRDEVVDIVIRDNKILKIGKCSLTDEYEKVIDASGCIVAPGLVQSQLQKVDLQQSYVWQILIL